MRTASRHGTELVREALSRFEDTSRALEATWSTERLHQVRIDGKKLRYTMEIMVDALPSLREPLRRLVDLQEVLGDLHDADVGLAGLPPPRAEGAPRQAASAWLRERYAVARQAALDRWAVDFGSERRRELIASIRSAVRQSA